MITKFKIFEDVNEMKALQLTKAIIEFSDSLLEEYGYRVIGKLDDKDKKLININFQGYTIRVYINDIAGDFYKRKSISILMPKYYDYSNQQSFDLSKSLFELNKSLLNFFISIFSIENKTEDFDKFLCISRLLDNEVEQIISKLNKEEYELFLDANKYNL